MTITSQQKQALEEIIQTILDAKSSRGKRQLAEMFLELVDKTDWPEYYEVIPEPRCINNIKAGVEKGRYKDVMQVYTDLSLVFWNALFYNEPESQIAEDAEKLKNILEVEWKKRPFLPTARTSPPPSSAQKYHQVEEEPKPQEKKPPSPAKATPVSSTPAQPAANPESSKMGSQPALRTSTPDVDVDIMSPDSDGADEVERPMDRDIARDPLSEEITRSLERSLPRWPGFGELGWMEFATPERIVDLVHAVKTHKDVIGNRYATALEEPPEDPVIPNLSYAGPLSLKMIESRARAHQYSSAREFDLDMARLFEKARRWHEIGSDSYGRVLLLQRLYQALTSHNPPVGPPYHSTTHFAALRAGPGAVKPVHGADSEGVPSVTTHRVLTKDRVFVEELHYKGYSMKLADWLHLANPDDPSRPIIGQIFRCWVSEEPSRRGQQGVTVSWYYRPEQTFHPPSRTFWEREVFKTSHFADHPVEDIIEKIACQFTARHVRGRPRPPYWFVGWPLYVCDSRYNDRERIFVKIKNWNSCVPEEVRKSVEFMPIYPFERMVYPASLPSPFLSKSGGKITSSKFPGGLLPETADADGNQKPIHPRREVATASYALPQQQPPRDHYPHVHHQTVAPSVPAAPAPVSYYSNAVYNLPQHQPPPPQPIVPQPQMHYQAPTPRTQGSDRSIISAAGGLAAIGGQGQVEKLPAETAKHFDRDPESNQVLWFASPPVDIARPKPARHSLDYLHFLAKKRKRAMEDKGEEEDRESEPKKSARGIPTVTELLQQAAKETLASMES
ncbi:bromeodomain-containing protein [Coprinopsis cinerea AmutBmut pab1-1]|nr:bromeodomain-containing protein [Coprinopsis cinerea AmutBmut pab1-1]